MGLRAKVGGLVYGCDICQDVCPWNVKFSQELAEDSPFRARGFHRGEGRGDAGDGHSGAGSGRVQCGVPEVTDEAGEVGGVQRNATVVLGTES